MTLQSGRFHKRLRLTVLVKLLQPEEPRVAEDAVTENVSPLGARVLVKRPIETDALLLLKSVTPMFLTAVRAVYCEPVSGGQFGVGLQLQGTSVDWNVHLPDNVA